MGLVLYSAVATLFFAALAAAAPVTGTLVVSFVVALVAPACWKRARIDVLGRRRRRT